MTEQELQEISERRDNTTAGPWRAWIEGRDHTSGTSIVQTGGDDIEMSGASTGDYDFIGNARQDVPRLVAEVRRLKSWLGEK